MTWLKSIAAELFGLFVDDGAFAVATLLWMVLLWWLLPHLALDAQWKALLLAGGLIAILVESVLRRARA
jgi:hypothetical protein